MSESHSDLKPQLKVQLEPPHQMTQASTELIEEKGKLLYLILNYEEKLIEFEKLAKRLGELIEELQTEVLQSNQLMTQRQQVEVQKCKLIRYQQYRDEPEWQYKLEQQYKQVVEKVQQYNKQLHEKNEHYLKIRQQVTHLKYHKERLTAQVEHVGEMVEQQEQIVRNLKRRIRNTKRTATLAEMKS